MTIVQLEYLLAVVNHGSFSKAARHCFVTQPSLSIQIQNLEEELGLILLDRNSKPIIPTQAGVPLLEQARATVAEFYRMKEKVNDLKGGMSGKLRLGIIPTIAPYLLPKFIPDFVKRCPDVELEICDMFPYDILKAISHDSIDIAILSGGDLPAHFNEQKLFVDKIYVYVSMEHALYNKSVICENDLDLTELLVLSEGTCLRNKRQEISEAKAKVKYPYTFLATSLETLMNTVDSTAGIAMIPGMAIGYIPKEKLKQVKVFAQPESYRTITMAVGRTCVKKMLIETVRESIMSITDQRMISELLEA